MLTRERQSLIQSRLAEQGRVIAADLSLEFDVSEDTIRRDLRELAASGLCQRVYGGALSRTAPVRLQERLKTGSAAKQALGRATAALLAAGSVVFIDAGSTNLAVAHAVPAGLRLTVVTNSPVIAAALMDKPDVEVVMIGGRVDAGLGACVDAQALSEAGRFHVDTYVLGVCAVDADAGLMAQSFEESTFKRAIAASSRQILVPLTGDKFEVRAPFAILPLTARTTLVLEAGTPAGTGAMLRSRQVPVVMAETASR